ncbi:hypothetical protein EGI11_07260 [Chryseobacterium sp. H3056]|uniref:Uncharacterized protein n=2 Tax=Kaistella daneshvariae TaxID=2487074 RepID=A0A3N0WVV6_9FLAO|nr:hypothetical protein EGI11_07260 [Kaistella daneshvariae]
MLLFLLGSKAQGQMFKENNSFVNSELVSGNTLQAENPPGTGTDPLDSPLEDNDPVPAPIDGFIPWLLTLAFGLIFYKKGLARS